MNKMKKFYYILQKFRQKLSSKSKILKNLDSQTSSIPRKIKISGHFRLNEVTFYNEKPEINYRNPLIIR